MNTELRDHDGNIIGKITTNPNGSQVIRNHNGDIKGVHNPVTNRTSDEFGNTVGYGNILTTLIV